MAIFQGKFHTVCASYIRLTLTKIRTCVSPILYFPSATLIIGNWVGHWHSDTNSLTCKARNNLLEKFHISAMKAWSLKENYSQKSPLIFFPTIIQVYLFQQEFDPWNPQVFDQFFGSPSILEKIQLFFTLSKNQACLMDDYRIYDLSWKVRNT